MNKTKFKILADKNDMELIIPEICVPDNTDCHEKITDPGIIEEEDTDFGIYKFLKGFMADTDIYKGCVEMSPSLEVSPSLAWNLFTEDN